MDFDIIDYFEKVTDKDAAIATRDLARMEGIMVGNSAGSAIAGVNQLADRLTKDDLLVVLFHDHGSRYVGKMFNDEWMRERGFLDDEMTVKDVISKKESNTFFSIDANQTVKEALNLMKEKDISQMPVMENGLVVGAVHGRQER